MKHIYRLLFSTLIVIFLATFNSLASDKIGEGQQPQISIDNAGIVRVVFGKNDSIFCSTSLDKGSSFSKRVLVGVVSKMHLGMARGPQLASSAHYSLITAMDQTGNIHFFLLDNRKGTWRNKGLVNDIKSSAPEGLMNIACDNQDNFYATWLDLRLNKRNNIFFSSLPAGRTQWIRNTLVYQSPDEHVCECCRPSIAVKGSNVAVMFRNWLNGSRDLYLATSSNKGQTFNTAVKLGTGTWKLNACPMDGGSLNFNANNTINTAWQRQGTIYYCKAGENEKELGKGRDCSISTNTNEILVTMSDGGNLKYKNVQTNKETLVGKGSYLKTLILSDSHVVCVWEEDHTIKIRVI
ncbi:MAG TPA: hypothetical protein VGN20_26350 [Mucilaginibacter sp.]|jgi:hypothetical protein